MLGVAVVGLGVGEQHARAYLQTLKCQLRWVYDLDGGRMDALIRELGAGARADSFDTVLADQRVDVVSIASYDDAHAGQVVAALEAGKHVFVEKPLCRSQEEFRSIREAWRANGCRQLAANLVLRAAPVYEWLKREIGAGTFGEIYAFDGDYLYGRIDKITSGWRADVDDYSVMQGGGVHLVDLMLWLTAQRPGSVTAVGNRLSTLGTRFRYDDFVAATFQFPSGLIGRITANFGCVHRHQHTVRVFGTKATFLCDDRGARVHTARAPAVSATELDLPLLPASKGVLVPAFIDRILNKADAHSHANAEFDLVNVCLATDAALKAARPVEIAYS